jgi:hypothetical protein
MKHVLHVIKLPFFRFLPIAWMAMLGFNHANAQAELFIATDGGDFNWTTGNKSLYVYPTGDSIKYLVATAVEGGFTYADASITNSTTSPCAPAVRRVQVNAFHLYLNSTAAGTITITGNSSGATGARFIRAVYVDDVLLIADGNDPRVTSSHPGGQNTENCADLKIEGLNIPVKSKVTVVIGGSATGSPGNFRVNVIKIAQPVLPVRLLSFDAIKRTNGVEVSWKAANENEGKSYSVERSNNGQNFEVIKSVETLGAGSYSFLDNAPKPGRIAYYRLQMVSVDGEINYSKIKAVSIDGSGELRLIPNPVRGGNLFATFAPVTEPTLVRVINASGQVVQTMQIASFTEQAQINTTGLKAGVYMLQILSGNEVKTSRFLKK